MNCKYGYRLGPGPFPVSYAAEYIRGDCSFEEYDQEYKRTQQPDQTRAVRDTSALTHEFGKTWTVDGTTEDGKRYRYMERVCMGRAKRPGDPDTMTREQVLALEAKWDALGMSYISADDAKKALDGGLLDFDVEAAWDRAVARAVNRAGPDNVV